jgi:hypothetical protein
MYHKRGQGEAKVVGRAEAEVSKLWKRPGLEENGRREEREDARERVLCKTLQRNYLRLLCQAL